MYPQKPVTKIVSGKLEIPASIAVGLKDYWLHALKWLLLVRSSSGDTVLFPTVGIEDGRFSAGEVASRGNFSASPNSSADFASPISSIRLQSSSYIALRSSPSQPCLKLYEVHAPISIKSSGGGVWESFNFKFPV